jgi:hypothetical protein
MHFLAEIGLVMRLATAALVAAMLLPTGARGAEVTDCDHSAATTYPSPDGRWVASVQEEVCAVGNRAAAAVNVDIASASDPKRVGRVFSMAVPRSRDRWPRIVWKDEKSLELWAPNRAHIVKPVQPFEDLRIELRYCGDNPGERAQMVAYQEAFQQWMKDTTEWVERRKRDPSDQTPRPKRPSEPSYSSDSCAGVGR